MGNVWPVCMCVCASRRWSGSRQQPLAAATHPAAPPSSSPVASSSSAATRQLATTSGSSRRTSSPLSTILSRLQLHALFQMLCLVAVAQRKPLDCQAQLLLLLLFQSKFGWMPLCMATQRQTLYRAYSYWRLLKLWRYLFSDNQNVFIDLRHIYNLLDCCKMN